MAENNLASVYGDDFYVNLSAGSSSSAAIILRLLFEHYQPDSVIDIGCGQGAWLAAAEQLGVKSLHGMDGDWVNEEKLLSKNIHFSSVNFDRKMPALQEKYDLCLSLEVAERIDEAHAQSFIALLCEASDVVLFSAAIKHQGGTNHVNEQWQSYWVELFDQNGFDCFDIFRRQVWNNEAVEAWYRQNVLLFVHRETSHIDTANLNGHNNLMLDLAHPLIYENLTNHIDYWKDQVENPNYKFCWEAFKRATKLKLKRG